MIETPTADLMASREELLQEVAKLKEELSAIRESGVATSGLFVIPASSVIVDPRQPQGQWRMSVRGVSFLEAIGLAAQLMQFCYQQYLVQVQQAAHTAGFSPEKLRIVQ